MSGPLTESVAQTFLSVLPDRNVWPTYRIGGTDISVCADRQECLAHLQNRWHRHFCLCCQTGMSGPLTESVAQTFLSVLPDRNVWPTYRIGGTDISVCAARQECLAHLQNRWHRHFC